MEYVQERITTLHELRTPTPEAPTDRTAVVVPMTEREYGGLAAEGVLSELATVDPDRVVVPLRAPSEKVGPFREWLDSFDLSIEVLWCSGPRVNELLADHGLNGSNTATSSPKGTTPASRTTRCTVGCSGFFIGP